MAASIYANQHQMLPAPTPYMPAGATYNLDALRVAQGQHSAVIPQPVAQPVELGAITDIKNIPTMEEVHLRKFDEFDDKLQVFNPDPRLEYRWVNSDDTRFSKLYRMGYRVVERRDAARTEFVEAMGSRLAAGTQRDGSARFAILMARLKTMREEQNKSYRKLMLENMQRMDPKNYSQNVAADRGKFVGSIVLQGSSRNVT